MPRCYRLLLDPETEAGNPPADPPKEGDKGPNPKAAADTIITKQGSAENAVLFLVNQTYELRDKNRELKAKIPADGSVVLSGDDVARWSAYQAIGKPEDIRKTIKEHGDLTKLKADIDRTEEVKAVGKASGLDADKFVELAHGLTFDWVEEDVKGEDGKTAKVKVPYIKDGENKVKVAEHPRIKQFLPVLQATEEADPKAGKSKGTPTRTTGPTKKIEPADQPEDRRKREPSLVR